MDVNHYLHSTKSVYLYVTRLNRLKLKNILQYNRYSRGTRFETSSLNEYHIHFYPKTLYTKHIKQFAAGSY